MRLLVACPTCARQFDATARPVGSHFRCLCGGTLTVPEAQGHDAAVVRCSACGAPRQEGSAACGFCGADFTLHERDLHTICPTCMARVSDRARYCHHCATALAPQPLGEATPRSCPACGDEVQLTSRRLNGEALSVLECPRCTGLWLGRETFGVVLERARRDAQTEDERAATGPVAMQRQEGALYRPCPQCAALMNRFNYGRRSGVIVDSCAAHGLWFDSRELDELLQWVRRGGEPAAARRTAEERGQLDRQRKLAEELRSGSDPSEAEGGGYGLVDGILEILTWFAG